jgi:hypothetical protein
MKIKRKDLRILIENMLGSDIASPEVSDGELGAKQQAIKELQAALPSGSVITDQADKASKEEQERLKMIKSQPGDGTGAFEMDPTPYQITDKYFNDRASGDEFFARLYGDELLIPEDIEGLRDFKQFMEIYDKDQKAIEAGYLEKNSNFYDEYYGEDFKEGIQAVKKPINGSYVLAGEIYKLFLTPYEKFTHDDYFGFDGTEGVEEIKELTSFVKDINNFIKQPHIQKNINNFLSGKAAKPARLTR